MRLDSVRHELFARAVVEGKTATDAYLLARYEVKSRRVAAAAGSRLLADVQVAARIAELRDAADAKRGMALDRTVAELARVAFSNPLDEIAFDDDGDPFIRFPAENREKAGAIQGVVVESYEGNGKRGGRQVKRIVFRSADKLTALAKLADLLTSPKRPKH